jgi:hypothetical protein
LPDDHEIAQTAERTTVVIDYPPTPVSDGEVTAKSFQKCITVCKTVNGVKACATVCVSISVGMDGIHGSVKVSVEATF